VPTWDSKREPQDEAFDVFVVVVPKVPMSGRIERFVSGIEQSFAGVDLPLPECQELLRSIRRAGGNGLVLAARYRTASLDPVRARGTAERELERLRAATHDELGPLGEAGDEGAWWTFLAENVSEQAKGRIPGTRTISIDKIDGHVVDQDERSEILELSRI
jgi:hypothetical protein